MATRSGPERGHSDGGLSPIMSERPGSLAENNGGINHDRITRGG